MYNYLVYPKMRIKYKNTVNICTQLLVIELIRDEERKTPVLYSLCAFRYITIT